MADDLKKSLFVFLHLGKNKGEVTHYKFVVKLIITELLMLVHLK